MNILFYCNEYPPFPHGGIGTFTQDIAEELAKKNVNIYVYGLYDCNTPTAEKVNGVTVIRDKKSHSFLGKCLSRISTYFRLKDIIKKNNIDILEVQDAGGLLAFYPKLKTNVVIRLHGTKTTVGALSGEKASLISYMFRILEKSHLQQTENIISVSQFTADFTRSTFGLNFTDHIHYNGVVPLQYEPEITRKYNDIVNYCYIGSLYERKGIFDLIKYWIEFSKQDDNANKVVLFVFGKSVNGSLDKLNETLREHDINNVCFLGHKTKAEIYEFLKKVHFVFIPSHVENFSLVPIESMLNKKVVYYTNQCSASELIADSDNGYLINGSDDLLNMLQHSYQLSHDTYSSIANNAYKTVLEKFTTDVTLNVDLAYYKKIIKNGN